MQNTVLYCIENNTCSDKLYAVLYLESTTLLLYLTKHARPYPSDEK